MVNKKTIILGSTIIIFGAIINASSSYANEIPEWNGSTFSGQFCTLSATNLQHDATMLNGQYKNDIGSANIKAVCDDNSGFSIYAVGFTNDEFGNNKMQSDSLDPARAINTGKYDQSTTTDSLWSIKLTPIEGSYTPTIRSDTEYDFTDFEVVPDAYTKTVSRTSATDTGDEALGASFNTNYAVYISDTQSSGTYTGKVKFVLVHPEDSGPPVEPLDPSDCPAYRICYAPNANDINGTMVANDLQPLPASSIGSIQSVSPNYEAELKSYNYQRPGYAFAGWSPSFDASTAANTTDTIYGPQATVSTNPNDGGVDITEHGLILYPVWVASAGTLQDWDGCSSLPQGEVTALTDIRDGDTYAVAKLVDGKCWIVENFRLNAESSRGENASLAQGYDTSAQFGNFIGLADSEDKFDTGTTANSIYGTTNESIINIGTTDEPNRRMPRYNNNNVKIGGTNAAGQNLIPDYLNDGDIYQWYGQGNLYSWPAAVASTSPISGDNYSADDISICPSGWRLPRGGDKNNEANNDLWALIVEGVNDGVLPSNYYTASFPSYNNYNEAAPVGRKLRSYPNNFVYAGTYTLEGIRFRDMQLMLWSSTSKSISNKYYSVIMDSNIIPGTFSFPISFGYSMRCLHDA